MAHQDFQRPVLGFLLLLLLMGINLANGHQHHDRHHHHVVRSHGAGSRHQDADVHARANGTVDGAEQTVEKALLSLAQINKARFENPKFNKREFRQQSTAPSLAAPLDYQQPNATARPRRRADSTPENANGYRIPPELAEAARLLAESSPQIPRGNHSEVAASARERTTFLRDTSKATNDTNTPLSLKTPEGRLSIYGEMGDPTNAKRQSSAWWMLAMASQGASPLAPSGYKVSVSQPIIPTEAV
jgi:hypothetical protein